jgi:ankyrin repeat protein
VGGRAADTSDDDARLAAFMEAGGFDASSAAKREGVTPLMSASIAGNVGLVRALLASGEDANSRYQGVAIGSLGLMRGATALHLASAVSCNAACVELLLRHAASLDARAGPVGITPLQLAAAASEDAVRALAEGCAAAMVKLNVHEGALLNHASALNIAAYMGTPAAVAALLDLGADASHRTYNGDHVWTDACSNAQMDVATLELIKQQAGAPSINTPQRPRTVKWSVIGRVFETLERTGCGTSDLVHGMANARGSTPLHQAARRGRLDVVRWLLENGAQMSTAARNARGRTPLQMAHTFGPHLAVEAELVGYQPSRPSKGRIAQLIQQTSTRDGAKLEQQTGTSTRGLQVV